MNYTQNHHLPQWVKSDRILMDDFNQMCADIEAGLTTAQSTANAAKTAASAAQSSANAAQAAANKAQTAADTRPYATGTYTGTGADMSIRLGFRPSFVFISGCRETTGGASTGDFSTFCCATSGHTITKRLVFTDTGFDLFADPSGGYGGNPILCTANHVYDYIAFK